MLTSAPGLSNVTMISAAVVGKATCGKHIQKINF
jgi:hypothetical protein